MSPSRMTCFKCHDVWFNAAPSSTWTTCCKESCDGMTKAVQAEKVAVIWNELELSKERCET